jgi:hypothetical protein
VHKLIRDFSIITSFLVGMTLMIWLPFLLRLSNFYGLDFSEGFDAIYRNFDGLEYIIISKSWYNPDVINSMPIGLSDAYFAAHFPGYSLLIATLAPLVGYLKSMLLISLLFTLLSAWIFYLLVRDLRLTKHPLLLSIIFLILPARWVIVHSVGSAEPVFICFTLATLYCFLFFEQTHRWRYILFTGIFGLMTQLTRPPGILLFISLCLYILWKVLFPRSESSQNLISRIGSAIKTYYPLLLIPFTLLLIFYWYHLAYGDFFAYFHSGDNIHLSFPPYQVFNKFQYWVGDIWLEDIVYIFLLGFLGGITLLKNTTRPLGFFVLTYLTATIFVAHRDISRYAMPIFPFLIIAFERVLTSREFKIALALIALGIYLYAENFLIANTAPIPNLSIFN